MTPIRPYRLVALASLLCLGGVLVVGAERPAPDAVDSPWKAVAASGRVESAAEPSLATWSRVRRGDHLDPLSVVRTGRRGRATLTRHASILMIDPSSELQLPTTPDGPDETTVIQTRGRVVYEIDGANDGPFRVVTPHLVAGVKGTVFQVTVNDDYAAVSVHEGLVEVTDLETGDLEEVGAGEMFLLDLDEETGMERVFEREEALRASSHEKRDMIQTEERHMARLLDQRGALGDETLLLADGENDDYSDDDSRGPVAGMKGDLEEEIRGADLFDEDSKDEHSRSDDIGSDRDDDLLNDDDLGDDPDEDLGRDPGDDPGDDLLDPVDDIMDPEDRGAGREDLADPTRADRPI